MKNEMQWRPITATEPPDGEVVLTRIDDGKGVRNEQRLYRARRPGANPLWWTADGAMYVYYTPTHYAVPVADAANDDANLR